MSLTYYYSFEMGPHISVTFPPRTVVVSSVTHPISRALIFTHLHSFFLALHFLLFPPFSEFPLSTTSCYQFLLPLSVLCLCHFPTFCHFALFLQLITFFSLSVLHSRLSQQLSFSFVVSFVLKCLCFLFCLLIHHHSLLLLIS